MISSPPSHCVSPRGSPDPTGANAHMFLEELRKLENIFVSNTCADFPHAQILILQQILGPLHALPNQKIDRRYPKIALKHTA